MKKVYYQLKLRQQSPLRISSGDDEHTDSDLLLDGRGFPFIPGSAVAGILRSMLSEDEANIFGEDIESEGIHTLTESHVLVSDAVLESDVSANDFNLSIRDGIEVDDWGMTKDGSKYDFQVAETKKEYVCIIEWNGDDEAEIKNILDPLMCRVVGSGLLAGARTTRGYGRFFVKAKKMEFVFPQDIQKWLEFQAFDTDAFDNAATVQSAMSAYEEQDLNIDIGIKMKGSFSVRVKTSDYFELEDGTIPDIFPMMNIDQRPVIPGTTWAGCFRHHMRSLIEGIDGIDRQKELSDLDHLFGKYTKSEQNVKSWIYFNETVVEGGNGHIIMRNAVDRFTQAPRNTALYTSMVWQNGTGNLHISVKKNAMTSFQRKLLAIALIDFHLGLMSFGGEAGIGRGMAEIETLSVNGDDKISSLNQLKTDFLEVAQ